MSSSRIIGPISLFLLALAVSQTANAFSRSTFTGRASSVCSRAELTTELRCPPTASGFQRRAGGNMSMPPFLKKLGLKKPGSDKEEDDKAAVAVEPAAATATILEEKEKDAKAVATVEEECVVEEELSESEKLLKKVKESGTAGIISYALWELGFWTISIPVCVFGYVQVTGHFPDFSDKEDLAKLGGEAFAFVNFARLAVPLRIGLALSTTPWIQDNVVDKFMKKDEKDNCVVEEE